MDCIFCQKPSDNSRGVEHIIPESLGNEDIILWRGAVCDSCNNYFSHIEGELLEQPYFISLRHRNFIKTKKNHLVAQKYFFPDKNIGWVDTRLDFEYGGPAISFEQNKENDIIKLLKEDKNMSIMAPVIPNPEPNNYIVSRFLAKCAVEYLVFRMGEKNYFEFSKELKDKQYDPIRKYARYGEGIKFWPYHQRRIYPESARFKDGKEKDSPMLENLHEIDLLSIDYTQEYNVANSDQQYLEIFCIVVIMGIEYAINIGRPEISGYEAWLKEHEFRSPVDRYNDIRIQDDNHQIFQISDELLKKMNR
ncbi:hypothetical protein AGMMS49546_10420 [Spirochaetia bacterium]|nr:hypothetical protein AGMMS49546_10420 [Spirochaetia bacterium]